MAGAASRAFSFTSDANIINRVYENNVAVRFVRTLVK